MPSPRDASNSGCLWRQTPTHDDARLCTARYDHLVRSPDQLTGKLIARTETNHYPCRMSTLLKQIDRQTPRELDLHLIADNYATHEHPKVRTWLDKHPRFRCSSPRSRDLVVLA